jgi:hypothetical protein
MRKSWKGQEKKLEAAQEAQRTCKDLNVSDLKL